MKTPDVFTFVAIIALLVATVVGCSPPTEEPVPSSGSASTASGGLTDPAEIAAQLDQIGIPVYPEGEISDEALSELLVEEPLDGISWHVAWRTNDSLDEIRAWADTALVGWEGQDAPLGEVDAITAGVVYECPDHPMVGWIALEPAGGEPNLVLVLCAEDAHHDTQSADLVALNCAAEMYRSDTGEPPTTAEDLATDPGIPGWMGPYLVGRLPLDPVTGEPYRFDENGMVDPAEGGS